MTENSKYKGEKILHFSKLDCGSTHKLRGYYYIKNQNIFSKD